MSAVEGIGWAGTVSGTILGLPQLLRLVRTGRVDGLSLTAWQAILVVNLTWTAHGISIGQVPQIVTSALSLCSTVPILYLMARELQRHLLPVLLPGLLAAGALIAVDQLLGSAAFGTAAIIPAVVANAGQSIELVRSARIVGVSVLFLILAVVNQGLWLSWAILVPDAGTMIFATVTGIITVFNLTWWSLRVLGLRPLLLPAPPVSDDACQLKVEPQPANIGAPRCSRGSQAGQSSMVRRPDGYHKPLRLNRHGL